MSTKSTLFLTNENEHMKMRANNYESNKRNVRACSECGKQPHIEHHIASSGFAIGWIISCKNGCYEKYEHDAENIGRWFQTFPWKSLKDAVSEWNKAVECKRSQ